MVERDGKEVTETKVVHLRGGQTAELSFGLKAQESVETVVTLHVPENATVRLAGSETKGQGTRRIFATRQLPAGKTWDNYNVQVSWEQDGRTVSKERTLTVRGGEQYDLQFGPESEALAAR